MCIHLNSDKGKADLSLCRLDADSWLQTYRFNRGKKQSDQMDPDFMTDGVMFVMWFVR